MGVHSVIIVSKRSEKLIYSRYFGTKKVENAAAFEGKVAQRTRPYWPKFSHTGKREQKWCTVCLESTVVLSFCMVGELVLYINGTDDFDEATLVEPGNVITDLLLKLLDKKNLSEVKEEDLLDEENKDLYAKFVLGVDEIVGSGIVEDINVNSVLRQIKLKST